LTVTFSPAAPGTYTGAVNLAYQDRFGPILPNANRNIGGLAVSLPSGGALIARPHDFVARVRRAP
jgi:hypothetical protein